MNLLDFSVYFPNEETCIEHFKTQREKLGIVMVRIIYKTTLMNTVISITEGISEKEYSTDCSLLVSKIVNLDTLGAKADSHLFLSKLQAH